MAICSNILAWKIPWAGEPGGLYSPWGHKESDMTEQQSVHSDGNLVMFQLKAQS